MRIRPLLSVVVALALLASATALLVRSSPTVAVASSHVTQDTVEASEPQSAAASIPQPNFIVLLTDDQSRYEFNREVMPNLFRLIVDEGMLFDDFTINTPVCGPSRATLLTGLYPHNHGVQFCDTDPESFKKWDAYYKNGHADNDAGAIFQRLGYRTSMVGKYVNSYGQSNIMASAFGESGHERYEPVGWDDFFVPLTLKYQNYDVVDGGQYVEFGDDDAAFRTDIEVSRAIDAIDDAIDDGKPFMTQLWVGAPHASVEPNGRIYANRHADLFEDAQAPRLPNRNEPDFSDKPSILQTLDGIPENVLRTFDLRQRDRLRSLQSVDEGIADIVAQLERRGELDDTYIFVLSDNGFHLGQHRLRSKMAPYEDSVNVPMAVRGPGIEAGTTSDHLVSMVDVLPTILDLAGQRVPADLDGQSFSHLLSGNASTDDFRSAVLVEHWTKHPSQYGDVNNASVRVTIRFEYQMLRSNDWVFIRWYTGELEYYDLIADPFQLENMASELSAFTTSQLTARLDELSTCEGVSCHDYGDGPTPRLRAPYPRHAIGSGTNHPVVAPTSAAGLPPELIAPKPDESCAAGDNLEIRWEPSALPGSRVDVRLEHQIYGSVVLVDSTPNDGTFQWRIDDDIPDGSQRVVVTSIDEPGQASVAHDIDLRTGVFESIDSGEAAVAPLAPAIACARTSRKPRGCCG